MRKFLFAVLLVTCLACLHAASYDVDPAAMSDYLQHTEQEDPSLASASVNPPQTMELAAAAKKSHETKSKKQCLSGACEQKPYSIVGELVPHLPGMGITLDKDGNIDTSKYDKLIKAIKAKVAKNKAKVSKMQHKVKRIAARDRKTAASLKAKIAALQAVNKSLHAKLRHVEHTPGPKGRPGPPGHRGERGRRGFTGPEGPQGKPGKPGKRGPAGAPGGPGRPGVDGRNGANGAKGPRGHRGARGRRGTPGPNGARGPVGYPGKQGPRGPRGPRGKRGLTGRRGAPGAVGPTGLMGEKGLPGRRGPPGFRGLTGEPGIPGRTGHVGVRGLPGVAGPRGYQGPQGPRGKRGRQGAPGHKGLPGHRGPKGFTGPTGPRGHVGLRGPQGFRGLHGRDGRIGKDGMAGRPGSPGKPGAPGRPGKKGPRGAVGPRGRPGLAGARGPPGITGRRGPTGLPGYRGATGAPGPQGPSGRPGHNKTVKKVVIRVSSHNKKLMKKLRLNLKKLEKKAAKKARKAAEHHPPVFHAKPIKFENDKEKVALEGSIINYVNNMHILSAEVVFKKNVKGKPGKTVYKTKANLAGHFGAMLKPGKYFVEARKDGFVAPPVRIHLPKGVPRSRMAMGMSPIQSTRDGGVRFVLTWGDHPEDLDSHLETPKKCKVIYYHRKCDNWGTATLDLDATRGSGPETITISKGKKGTYEYSVQQFSKDGTLAKSEGKVMVFDGDKITVFRASKAAKGKKSNGIIDGKIWKVLKWEVGADGKGKIVRY